MKARLIGSLLLTMLLPAVASPAFPAGQVATVSDDAMLGCRWRRCVRFGPSMPRADETVRLVLNLDKGPPFYVEATTETKQIMKVMGQDVQQTQTQTFYQAWTPLGTNQAGDALVRMKIIGIDMVIDIGGSRIAYNSYDPEPSTNPLVQFMEKLVNAEFKLTVDRREMTIRQIDGLDELLKRFGPSGPQMEPLLKSIMTKDTITQQAQPQFAFLPKEPVRRGDTWRRQDTLGLGPLGTYRSDSTYTYAGKSGPHDKILVQTSLKYEAPKHAAGLPFTIKKADLKSTTGAGEILFDAAKGRLVESTQRLALVGSLTIDIGGMETRVDLEQSQTMRVRVRDENPVQKKDQ